MAVTEPRNAFFIVPNGKGVAALGGAAGGVTAVIHYVPRRIRRFTLFQGGLFLGDHNLQRGVTHAGEFEELNEADIPVDDRCEAAVDVQDDARHRIAVHIDPIPVCILSDSFAVIPVHRAAEQVGAGRAGARDNRTPALIVRYNAGELVNGFIVGDILLNREITLEDLRPFFAKWDVLRNQNRATRFQPMFIADFFTSEALGELRKRGCFVAILTTLFGEEIAQQLHQLVGVVEHAAAEVTNNPQSVFSLLSKVAKIEGAALNLRGVVIELVIGRLFQLLGYQIDIRQQTKSEDDRRAEIDVKATNRKEVVCFECKGKGPNALVDAAEIQEWLDTSLVRIKSWLKLTSSLPDSRRFEFYTSTDYTPEAKELIAQIEVSHKKQPIRFFTGADVINKLKDQKERALVDIFHEHFLGK